MSFVNLVPEAQASPNLRQIYDQLRVDFGFLPNYFQALGRDPELVTGHLTLGSAIMEDGALPKVLKEQIGVVVSGINSSSYCIAIHMELLKRLGIEKPVARKLAVDYPNAPVDNKAKALFRFADKLTRKPFDIDQPDVDEVLQAGWDEAALFETVLVVSYFNLVNRISIGLGLVADF